MAKCSDPTYEPGPVAALDLGDFDGTLEPPAMTPIAQSFASHNADWLSTLDAAYGALEAESALDLGGDVLDTIGGVAAGASASINAEANAHLVAAEDGYSALRDRVGELKTWLPPDVLQTATVSLLSVFVTDAAGAPVAGALVTSDANIGAHASAVTDAGGEALLEVPPGATIGVTVTAAGHPPADSVVTASQQVTVLRVQLA